MITIDLVKDNNSSYCLPILNSFPDGQNNVNIEWEGATQSVKINSRLNNWKDLELICCTVASLRNLKVQEIHLFVPYFLGSRSDRKFSKGGNNYLKDVICPVINNLNLSSVSSLDPHSYVLEACLNNFEHIDISKFYDWAYKHIDNEEVLVFSPDSGAIKRTETFCKQVEYNNEIFTCNKVRNKEGQIVKTEVPNFNPYKDIVIIDDICDGGGTFIEIAKIIRNRDYTGKITLIVTHGIFNKGLLQISNYFNAVYCTNSYSDITIPEIHNKDFIFKQFNLF